jgi:hypothetical protein
MSKREVTLPQGPHVDPRVQSPQALKYARDLEQRKYQQPVAGGPTPPIPRLDQPHHEGMTMADQANRHASMPSSPLFEPGGGMPPGPPPMHRTGAPTPTVQTPQSMGILPTDVLPENAKNDPGFQHGMGSMLAAGQPHLAHKYGVLRNGQFIPPQQLQTGRPGLSSKSIEGLKALQDFQNQSSAVSQKQAESNSEVSGAAGAAARLANAAGDEDTKPLSEEDKKRMERAIDKMDDFDFNTFREMMMKDILNNEDQRKAIEGRLEPLDITDLIMNNRVFQRVPIVPGKYEPTFQSVTGEEDLALKRMIWQEQKSLNAPNQYMLDKYSLMGVALSTYAINHTVLPNHVDNNGVFNEEAFLSKFNFVIRLPFHMLSSLGINFFWFDVRVRKLFQADALKNG